MPELWMSTSWADSLRALFFFLPVACLEFAWLWRGEIVVAKKGTRNNVEHLVVLSYMCWEQMWIVEDWNLEASDQWKGPCFHQPNCSSMFLSKSQAHLDGFFFPGKTCEQSISAHRVPLLYPDSCRLMLHCPDSCLLLPISFLVSLAEWIVKK